MNIITIKHGFSRIKRISTDLGIIIEKNPWKSVKSVLIRVSFFVLFYLSFTFPLFAESNFSLRAAPVLVAPLGAEQLNAGVGAGVSLDWSFWNFADDFDFGLSAGGVFSNVPMKAGDPIMLMEGKGGLFLRYSPFDRWAFRLGAGGGAYQYSRGEDNYNLGLFGFSLGAQFHLSPYFSLFADGGYSYRVFSSKPLSSLDFALGVRINLSEVMGGRARVQVEKTQQYRVFPVSYAWYEDNPVASVTVTNNEPNAISDLQLTFFMESYMSQPWVFANVPALASGESIEVPVTALFNEALINLNEAVTANGILQMQYRSLGAKKEAVSPIQMPIFNRNTLSWDDDRRAAAFVSPRDFAVRVFARNVVNGIEKTVYEEHRNNNTPSNVIYAVALFEALRNYGISYIVDPSSSYIALSEDESALDSLNYPYQTLYYRGGDCDDLSILFCSLLEALDIESAFITVPGHIYAAFEVGDDSWQVNNPDIININGKRWLPVEITVPNQGFTRAWRIGASQWHNAGAEAELLPIRECWEIYPSVTVPASGDNPPEMPAWTWIYHVFE